MYSEINNVALRMARETLFKAYRKREIAEKLAVLCPKCKHYVLKEDARRVEYETARGTKTLHYHPECYAAINRRRWN